MIQADLVPLDSFNTYKPILNGILNIPEKLLDYGIKVKGRHLYGDGAVNCNHVRIYVGLINGEHIGFEWTHPRARFITIEDWMMDSDYAKIYRHKDSRKLRYNTKLFSYLTEYEGSRYDYLQLLGIALGAKWLQMSKFRKVCAQGVVEAHEYILRSIHNTDRLFPESETWATLPCAWMNHAEQFNLMNGGSKAKILKPELKTFASKIYT
jgi:hypothetical protein